MGLKNYYSPQQATKFLQENGNPNFDEHDLTMLVVDGILNPLFFFQGVLSYLFVPSYADNPNYLVSNSGDNPRGMEMLLNFQGHISPKENDVAINISKPNKTYSAYFFHVKAIEVKDMNPFVYEYETDSYDYQEALIQIQKIDRNSVFQLTSTGNTNFKDDLGILFSSDDCRFSLVELKKLLPVQPELMDIQSNDAVVLEQKNRTVETSILNLEQPRTDINQMQSNLPTKQKKYRMNDFRMLVLNELINNPDRKNVERWLHFKIDSNNFDVTGSNTLKLKSDDKPITREAFDRCIARLRKIPKEEWDGLLKR